MVNEGRGLRSGSRARRFTPAGFLLAFASKTWSTKAQFNGVGGLRTYISFMHSAF
jgi:hypothetical protein